MNSSIQTDQLILGKHQFGRIDQRMKIGPVTWSFHDLFWLHEGEVTLSFSSLERTLSLTAPDGVLILPGTRFSGRADGSFATASVCHFECLMSDPPDEMAPGYFVARRGEGLHIHNQIRLAMQLAQKRDPCLTPRRQRLMHSILDGFESPNNQGSIQTETPGNKLISIWEWAADHLHDIRSLNDVARIAGVSESGLRKIHRATFETSAGDHLRNLRLTKGEELLATTGFSILEIATQVGYGHAESFCTAFKISRGLTPGQFRRWSKPFA